MSARRRGGPWPWLALALLVLGTIVGGAWWIWQDVQDPEASAVATSAGAPSATPRRQARSVQTRTEAPPEDTGVVEVEQGDAAAGPTQPEDTEGLRKVALTLLCDDCPDVVRCTGSHLGLACAGSPPELQCWCKEGDVEVTGHTTDALFDWSVQHEVLGSIPDGENAWRLDRRGERGSLQVVVEGIEEGEACWVWLDLDGHRAGGRELVQDGGEVVFEDLRPGEFELVVAQILRLDENRNVRTEEVLRVPASLGSGEQVDLGVVRLPEVSE